MFAINTNTGDGVLTVELLEKFNQYSSDLIALIGPQSQLINNLITRKEGAALSIYQLAKSHFDQVVIECVSHQERVGNLRSTSNAAKSLAFGDRSALRDNGSTAAFTGARRGSNFITARFSISPFEFGASSSV